MAVYVDAMVDWGKRIGAAGPKWCHMIADSLEELHTMAQAIGMKRSWFQDKSSCPHYDIGSQRIRDLALSKGVVACDRQTFVTHMKRIRAVRVQQALRRV